MHSSAVSSRPLTMMSIIAFMFNFSAILSTRVPNSAYADFLIGIPSSTLCLNGPRSTSFMYLGLIWVSTNVIFYNASTSFLIALGALCAIVVSDSNAFLFTWRSSSCISLIKKGTHNSNYITSQSFDPPYLKLFTIVVRIRIFLDCRPYSIMSYISIEYCTNNLPIFSATTFLILMSSFWQCYTSSGNSLSR